MKIFSALAFSLSLFLTVTANASSSSASSEDSLPLTIDDVLTNAKSIQTELLNQKRFEAIMLVSSSMPEASLKRLAIDAKDAGIPLVFRGVPVNPKSPLSQPLLNPESLKVFNFLVELGASVELNPEIFKEIGLSEVPALIIREHQENSSDASEAGSCNSAARPSSQNTALVLGDVTLGYMLDTLLDRHDEIGKEARRLRQKLGDRP